MKNIGTAAAVAALAFAAVPAAAVVVTGATEIHITNAFPTYLQVAEVQAFDFASTNVAAAANGGAATGSSVYSAASSPDKAIDGDSTNRDYPNIFHSLGAGSNEFLDITFAAANLSSLSIFGRSDCCNERDLYNVVISNALGTTLYSGTVDARGQTGTVTFGTVPEPASWALMIAGFGLVGFAARSRRSSVAA